MKTIFFMMSLIFVASCSSKDVQKVDKKAEEVRKKIKKDEDYCSPLDKTLKTDGCGD